MTAPSLRVTGVPLVFYSARAGSRVAVLFTSEAGQVRIGVRTSARAGAARNLPIGLFSTYEMLIEKRARGGELFDLKECEVVDRRTRLGGGKPMEAWAAASVLAELLTKTTEPFDPQPYPFAMLCKALDFLEGGRPAGPLLLSFLLKYLAHMGLGFQVASLPPGDQPFLWASIATGEFFVHPREANPVDEGAEREGELFRLVPVSRPVLEALSKFRVAVFERLGETPWTQNQSEEAFRLVEYWLEHHLDVRLKSLQFWRDLEGRRRINL